MNNRYRFDIKAMNADCEANYARMLRLAAGSGIDLFTAGGQDGALFHIDVPGLEPTSLELLPREQGRYTTTLDLHLRVDCFGESGYTSLVVRLYHDVNMAEVIACNRQRSRLARYQYPNDTMFQPDEKAQQNRFLAECLSLYLSRGMHLRSGSQLDSWLPASMQGTSGAAAMQGDDRDDRTTSTGRQQSRGKVKV